MQAFEETPEERLTPQEQRLLFKRWADAEHQKAAAQSEPTVADIAEATGMPAAEVRQQLQSVRAAQAQLAEASRLRREQTGRAVRRGLPLLAALGLGWAAITHLPTSHRLPAETAVTAASRHAHQGDAQFQAGRFEDAEGEYLLAVQQQPEIATYRNALGNALYSQKKYAQALPQYQKAVQLMPGRANYVQNRADTLLELHRYTEAAASFRSALTLDPGSAAAETGLGASLAKVNRYAQAEAAYREALRLSPANADTLDGLGAAIGEQHRITEAAGYFREAVALAPGNAQYRHNLDIAEKMLRAGKQ